jgi:Transcriptional regulators containing a DNA-binding HTH domain and an aminotransferase domain (MocR family) and their eukaryotic orthologs
MGFFVPHGGFYLWIKQDDPDIFQKLLSLNILVKPGPIYGASKKSFRFNFAYFNTQERIKLINALMKLN